MMSKWIVPDYSVDSYREFLRLKQMPIHRVEGDTIHYEDLTGAGNVGQNGFNPSLYVSG